MRLFFYFLNDEKFALFNDNSYQQPYKKREKNRTFAN